MELKERIEVAAHPDRVWALFQDVPELARCLPGAELTGRKEDGTWTGKVTAKLGPMTATFEGEATVTAQEATRNGSVVGRGVDRAGGSVGQLSMDYRLAPVDGGTVIEIDADIRLSGKAAQFGRPGLIKEMSKRLIDEFVACVEAKVTAETAEEAAAVEAGEVRGIALFFASLLAWIRQAVGRLLGRSADPS